MAATVAEGNVLGTKGKTREQSQSIANNTRNKSKSKYKTGNQDI